MSAASDPGPVPAPEQAVADVLTQYGRHARRIWVAFSGGLDSSALLQAVARTGLAQGRLHAIHVHHGLQAEADAWQAHCAAVCERLKLPLRVERVALSAGAGLEQRARQARYQVFSALLADGDLLLLGHHRDDQLETLLLRLLTRGGGADGLRGMPVQRPLAAGTLHRPFLKLDRVALLAYARSQHLDWITDLSNRDTRMDRNQLRHRLLPLLEARWPQARDSLDAALQHLAEDAKLLQQALDTQLQQCLVEDGQAMDIARLGEQLAPVRVLRHWFAQLGVHGWPEQRLAELWRQLHDAGPDRQPSHPLTARLSLKAYDGRVWLVPAAACEPWPGPVDWQLPQQLNVPAGTLTAERCVGAGLADSHRQLSVQPLPADTRLQRHPDGGSRRVQSLLAAARVPPWLRPAWPGLYHGAELVAVPGIAVAAGAAAKTGEPGWLVHWTPLTAVGSASTKAGQQVRPQDKARED